MKARGSGHILNVASAAGLLCPPGMAPYNASKAAVIALSETMAAELAGSGVGVTVLCPSFFPTELLNSDHVSGEMTDLARLLMQLSPHSAADIARIGLDAAVARKQVVVPHLDTQALWRLKRLNPAVAGWFTRTMGTMDNPLTAKAVSLLLRDKPANDMTE
jgi:short-subunit dehydrogenase